LTETATRLHTLIADQCDVPAAGITPGTYFTDLPGWSSLAALRLLGAVEESFGIRLDLRRYLALATVGELTGTVAAEAGR
jgi:acyl carrier protein